MRYLLAFFFFMMYAGDNLGLNISLGPGLSSKNLILYVILISIAVNSAVARNRSFEMPSAHIAFVVLILYALMTWITVAFVLSETDYHVRASFISLKSSLVDQYLTFLIFFFGLNYAKDAHWLLLAIIWITVVGNLVTLIDTFNVPNLGILQNAGSKAGRFDGFIGQPNAYGQVLVLFIAPTIALFGTETGKRRVLAAIGVFVAVMALVLTGSRGSWLGLLAGSAFAAFFLRNMISIQMLARTTAIAVLVCAAVVIITAIAGYSDLYLSSFEKFEGGANRATSGRATIWATAIKAMLEQPLSFLTGYGFNAYDSSRQFYAASHNVYLNYLYDLGAIGVFLFIYIFSRILVTARSVIATANTEVRSYFVALVFGLSGFLVAIFFSEYHNSAYLLWAFLGVVMRMAMIARSGSDIGVQFSDATSPAKPPFRDGPVVNNTVNVKQPLAKRVL